MRGQKTDNKTKAKVRASYALTNSYNATAKELRISDKTVKKIIEENPKEFAKVSEKKKQDFADKATTLIDKAMDRLSEELENKGLPINQLSTVIGTLYDKRALYKGESTENNKFEVNIKVVK